jgi:hypothetical protein
MSGCSSSWPKSAGVPSTAPGHAGWLVGADQDALVFLTGIGVAFVVHGDRDLLVVGGHLGDRFGDQIMVLHGLQRQLDAGQAADLAGP